jgi:hypothetical protein
VEDVLVITKTEEKDFIVLKAELLALTGEQTKGDRKNFTILLVVLDSLVVIEL